MIVKDVLREVVKSQRRGLAASDYGVKREGLKEIDLDSPYAIVLSGVRRCGKSTLLHQLTRETRKFYYFNFEDPRIVGFDVGDFQKLDEVFHEEFGDSDQYFLDEIQNVEKWEIFVRSKLDAKKRFAITGSNASLLSRELGTRLTGRHLTRELFPFSFKETLELTGKKAGIESFDEYLSNGGFPEYLKTGKTEYLRELLNDVIERDIIVRHGLRDAKTLKQMAAYLITNCGKEFSYNSLKKIFGLGSVNSAISFVSFFEDSYLLFTVPRFDYSLKKQLVSPKKAYAIDNGLANANSVSFSSDSGRMLENTVFLHLRKMSSEIFYFKEKGECDFLVKEKDKITQAIQVCYELNDDNKQRELAGIIEAAKKVNLQGGLILTHHQDDEFTIDNKNITVRPAWKWMLERKHK